MIDPLVISVFSPLPIKHIYYSHRTSGPYNENEERDGVVGIKIRGFGYHLATKLLLPVSIRRTPPLIVEDLL